MKKTLLTVMFLVAIACTFIIVRAYNYYSPPQLREPYKVYGNNNNDDTLRIAFIGDSWAYMHKSHNCKIAQIIEDSIQYPVSVNSFGICGLTSKEIYESLFENPKFKYFLQERSYNYCIISAGINDTYKKMNSSYYKKSMKDIIDFLLANHIHPIILEIPDYNINQAYNRQKIDKKLLRRLSMLVNNTSLDCKQEFRDALDELINAKGYKDKVSIIRYKSWNIDYKNDLKRLYLKDGMHLNEDGYQTLDSKIVDTISQQFANNL